MYVIGSVELDYSYENDTDPMYDDATHAHNNGTDATHENSEHVAYEVIKDASGRCQIGICKHLLLFDR